MSAWYAVCALYWSIRYGIQERREQRARTQHTVKGARE